MDQESVPFEDMDRPPTPERAHLLAPIDLQEVWAAGVTYLRSRAARMQESEAAANHYEKVYDAPRPELFFKATPHRTVGPNAEVRIRADSAWNVPEPELTLLITPDLRLAGFTVGNDMSSRDIEGENPLYLPQAKIYLESCALGPVITLAEAVADPKNLNISMSVERKNEVIFSGWISTSQMKREFHELIEYLSRANAFPHGAFLLTGTGIVPPAEFTLEDGDFVSISIEAIGTLKNPVKRA
jgi:2-dehydro-3-deoxy-D-arabinonate dehydratase